MIYITGDCHGGFDRFENDKFSNLTKNELVTYLFYTLSKDIFFLTVIIKRISQINIVALI